MDELVEESMSNDADMMTAAEREVWEARKQDGLALARYYEAKLRNNPQQLIHQKKDVMVKAVIRAVRPSSSPGGGGGGMGVVCQECRQGVEGGREGGYEATWSLPAAQGLKPVPTTATVHLGCLRASACKAIRKGLSPEGVLSLGFKLDVQSLFVGEEGGLEGFKKSKIQQALSEERQEYPWWVDGAIKLQIPTNKKIQLVPLSGAPAVARGSFMSSAASALYSGVASVASAASSVLCTSPGAAAAAAAARPRRSPRQPQQQQQSQQQQQQQQQPQQLVLDVDDD